MTDEQREALGTGTIEEICKAFGIKKSTYLSRISYGWDRIEALTMEKRQGKGLTERRKPVRK